jgi:hypothetical protein
VVNKHQPFDDHTLQLLNAAVWFCESRRPNGRYEWRVIAENGGRMSTENKRAAVGVDSASGSPNHPHSGGA